MKDLFKSDFFRSPKACGVLMILSFLVLGLPFFVGRAAAEPEGYIFPPEPIVVMEKPGLPDVDKQMQAKKDSIAVLLRQYNKKLSDEKSVQYADYIVQAAEKFGQDPFVITAMVVNESSARHDAVSKGGDYGLMQVRWRVHQKKITKKYPHITQAEHILDPEHNLLVGTEIFSTYRRTAKQDIRGGLLYYSAGNKRLADKIFAVLSRLEKAYVERLKNI